MSFIVPCSIVVLVNRYLTVSANEWSDKFNYIVCNEELKWFVWLSKTNVDHGAQNGMRV